MLASSKLVAKILDCYVVSKHPANTFKTLQRSHSPSKKVGAGTIEQQDAVPEGPGVLLETA